MNTERLYELLEKLTSDTARVGVMHLGPFIGRHNLDHATRALSRLLGLRTCSGKLALDEDFSPCVYGQIGHCAAPCNLTVDEALAPDLRYGPFQPLAV